MTTGHTISRLRLALGTFVAVEAEARDESAAHHGVAAAFEAVTTVERLMHPSRDGSDLAALTATPLGTPVTVHPWTWEVLALCRRLNEVSLGIFDPCLGMSPGRFDDLELQSFHCVIAHAPMRVDLGGIAKGYAVDRAIDALRTAGCAGGLVNAGGDVAVFGPSNRNIVCGEPNAPRLVVELRNGALATSDTACLSRPAEHRGYYHGANRRVTVSGQVTVLAKSAAIADGLTKCLLAGDRALNRTLLRAFDARQFNTSVQPSYRAG
jgi:thiamine biosynthesis lipoprotein